MVKRLLLRLIYENGSKALNSIFKAYKETVKNAPKGGQQQQQQQENKKEQQQGGFGKFNFNNLISTPMFKEEAVKILNIKEADATPEKIMEQFEKYFEANDPMKGGSFYLQNKIYYAKEVLMEKYPKELNKSKFNPDWSGRPSSSSSSSTSSEDKKEDSTKAQEEDLENKKNKNI